MWHAKMKMHHPAFDSTPAAMVEHAELFESGHCYYCFVVEGSVATYRYRGMIYANIR